MSLSANRSTDQMGVTHYPVQLPVGVKANAVIYQGALVGLDATGFLVPAQSAVSILGRAEQAIDATGAADGALSCEVRFGVFKWNNSSAGDAIAAANAHQICFAVDDQTVALTDGGTGARPEAGVIMQVDADGVWVANVPSGVAGLLPIGGAQLATVPDQAVDGGVPEIYPFSFADAATNSKSVVVGHKIEVIDFWGFKQGGAGAGGNTVQVFNNVTAISDAVSGNVADKTRFAAGQIDDAANVIAAGGTLTVTNTKVGGNAQLRCFVVAIRKS